ncbi:hypothetical protein FRACYDRAFT_254169 [Fragilariopsis cylindrus CCMP1102]|uniref:Uncharacterized protein n=1 Tax=Fragilariopsis cylindrus CCMP1102 TaxID=635003 RepID=A0A1E7EL38_9STRA|nr:hypothetical protein FRACYDRAFT_254169 [Fragilariopsis cylindrus CCMP1102]|eukprot:OEU06618.1 hypothetical protein FRACYDRAFT_254169 [Fragilariopsis cylindrus CCMP1102]
MVHVDNRDFDVQSMSVSLSGNSMSDRFRMMQSMSQAARKREKKNTMKPIRQDNRDFAVQSVYVSLSGNSMSDRCRMMQSMSQVAHNDAHRVSRGNSGGSNQYAMSQSLNSFRSRGDVTRSHSDSMREMPHSPYGIRSRREVSRVHSDSMREMMPQAQQASPYGIRNARRVVSRTNSDSMLRIPISFNGFRNRRGVTRTSIDNVEEMAQSLYSARNRRGVSRTSSSNMEEMAQSLYGNTHNKRGVSHTKSDDIQSMSQSRNGIRYRGITRMSQALDLTTTQGKRRASSYISRRSNSNNAMMPRRSSSSNSNNAMSGSLNGFTPSTNQEGIGEYTNQQRNRARVQDDGLSRSLHDVRDRSSQYRGMTRMDDDNYGNKNEPEVNAAIQQDQELIKLSSSSFGNGNSNLCTNDDSAPHMANFPEKYGAAVTKDNKLFVQQHNHIRTITTTAATTTETETKQQQQQDSLIDANMINESMKVLMESMKRSAASRKIVKQFKSPFATASDDKTPSSSLSNSTSILLSSNTAQHLDVKSKRNSTGRCKQEKPQLLEKSRGSSYGNLNPFSFDTTTTTTTTTRWHSPTPFTAFTTSEAVHPSDPSPSNNNNFFSNQLHQHPCFPSHNNDDLTNNDRENDVNVDDDIVSFSSATSSNSWSWPIAEAATSAN